jgi:hypothetical protein
VERLLNCQLTVLSARMKAAETQTRKIKIELHAMETEGDPIQQQSDSDNFVLMTIANDPEVEEDDTDAREMANETPGRPDTPLPATPFVANDDDSFGDYDYDGEDEVVTTGGEYTETDTLSSMSMSM